MWLPYFRDRSRPEKVQNVKNPVNPGTNDQHPEIPENAEIPEIPEILRFIKRALVWRRKQTAENDKRTINER
jgi:hypothetical protein